MLNRRRGRSPGDRLRDALLALAAGRAQMLLHEELPWASITFSGVRHRFILLLSGDEAVAAGENLIAELAEHEFTLPGHFAADAAVTQVEHRLLPSPRLVVECEVLLLADG